LEIAILFLPLNENCTLNTLEKTVESKGLCD
jgi:hypothetical protein